MAAADTCGARVADSATSRRAERTASRRSLPSVRKWTSAKTNPDGSDIPRWLSRPVAELPTHGRIGLQGKHAGELQQGGVPGLPAQ